MTTTDSPLVLSLVDLPRTLGASRHRSLTWTAPKDLGTPVMGVVPGTPLELDVTLTSVDEGVLVSVRTQVDLVGECVRCLKTVHAHHPVDTQEVYFERSRPGRRGTRSSERQRGHAEEDEDEALSWIGPHDTIDLEPLMRDAIVPLVDPLPLCRPDCPGLCPVCGERLEDLPADHHHDVVDPRLAGLAALLDPERADGPHPGEEPGDDAGRP